MGKELCRKMNICPKCKGEMCCLAGESAHPSNWYCKDEDGCGYQAWNASAWRPKVITSTNVQFNELTPAEHERLSILIEECAEVIHIGGKILRHGYESTHPGGGPSNRAILEEECGHVRYAMINLCNKGDLDKITIHSSASKKEITIKKYLHHNEG